MTQEKKKLVLKIFTGVCITLLASLIIWIITSLVKENKIYGQMRQTPKKVEELKIESKNNSKKTDSLSNVFLIHNSVQVEQIMELHKKIDGLNKNVEMLIQIELTKK